MKQGKTPQKHADNSQWPAKEVNFAMYGTIESGNSQERDSLIEDRVITSTEKSPTFCESMCKSDRIFKFFISVLFGIIPRKTKTTFCFLLPSIVIAMMQWYSVCIYVHMVFSHWSKVQQFTNSTRENLFHEFGQDECMKSIIKRSTHMPIIPTETAVLLLGLVMSGAITATFGALYFRANDSVIARKGMSKFDLIPKINSDFFDDDGSFFSSDWLITNMLFLFGLLVMAFAIFTDQFYNTFYDFLGIHFFLYYQDRPLLNTGYYVAIFGLFWGYGATICACCLFHAMTQRMISRIDYKEQIITSRVSSRLEFLRHNRELYQYRSELLFKFRYWFASHNMVFIVLLAAIIYEWLKVFKGKAIEAPSTCQKNLLMSQLSGTFIIIYKFAFPIISASLVTNRFRKFYMKLATSDKIRGVELIECLTMSKKIGFEIFSVRITPQLAITISLSCFIGILKVADFAS